MRLADRERVGVEIEEAAHALDHAQQDPRPARRPTRSSSSAVARERGATSIQPGAPPIATVRR